MGRLLYFISEYFIIEKKLNILLQSMNFGRDYRCFCLSQAIDCRQLFSIMFADCRVEVMGNNFLLEYLLIEVGCGRGKSLHTEEKVERVLRSESVCLWGWNECLLRWTITKRAGSNSR